MVGKPCPKGIGSKEGLPPGHSPSNKIGLKTYTGRSIQDSLAWRATVLADVSSPPSSVRDALAKTVICGAHVAHMCFQELCPLKSWPPTTALEVGLSETEVLIKDQPSDRAFCGASGNCPKKPELLLKK